MVLHFFAQDKCHNRFTISSWSLMHTCSEYSQTCWNVSNGFSVDAWTVPWTPEPQTLGEFGCTLRLSIIITSVCDYFTHFFNAYCSYCWFTREVSSWKELRCKISAHVSRMQVHITSKVTSLYLCIDIVRDKIDGPPRMLFSCTEEWGPILAVPNWLPNCDS